MENNEHNGEHDRHMQRLRMPQSETWNGSMDMERGNQSKAETGSSPLGAAKRLYGSAFEARDKDEVVSAMHEWKSVSGSDREFISNHLRYLNLKAQTTNGLLLRRLLLHLESFTANVSDDLEDVLNVLEALEGTAARGIQAGNEEGEADRPGQAIDWDGQEAATGGGDDGLELEEDERIEAEPADTDRGGPSEPGAELGSADSSLEVIDDE